MKLTKIDLSNVLAISHNNHTLGLVVEHEDSLEIIEIPAPLAAYEGLQQLNAIVNSPYPYPPDLGCNPRSLEAAKIPMQPVQSTLANAVGYDAKRNLLQVEFNNGSVYQYEDVDRETWQALQTTDSPGRFFNRQIKGNYASRRVNQDH